MFKKLRNKFLILNLVSISIMMIIAFVFIYLLTYKDVTREINKDLNRLSAIDRRPVMNEGYPRFKIDVSPPREPTVFFTITTDNDFNIMAVSSPLDMDEEFYEEVKSTSLSKNVISGNFKHEGNYWAFMKTNQPSGLKIVFLDITPQKSILNRLIYTFLAVAAVMLIFIFLISRFFANKAIRPVEDAFSKQKQFIADASHELKTPLTVINTNVDVLLSDIIAKNENAEEQSKWLYYIKSEIDRMSKLINDLLYLARLDDNGSVVYSVFDFSKVVENVILTMEAVIFENNIALEYDVEPGIMANGNSEQMEQVVMILLDNAVKYSGKKGRVRLYLERNYNNAVLSVTNTGEGIPPQCVDRIFDRFYRGDKSRARSSGGHGLGLAIAKSIVEKHGGKIYAKSLQKEYTTFSVELPLVK